MQAKTPKVKQWKAISAKEGIYLATVMNLVICYLQINLAYTRLVESSMDMEEGQQKMGIMVV